MAPKRKRDDKSNDQSNDLSSNKSIESNTNEFFVKAVNDPSNPKFYYKNRYIFCYIAITELDVYKNLESKFTEKIDYNGTFNQNINKEKICQYVFMKLFRFLFYLDFIHDFANTSRTQPNALFKNIIDTTRKVGQRIQKDEKNKRKEELIKRKNEIIDIYDSIYREDIDDIREFIFKNNKIKDSSIILKNFTDLNDLDNITNIKKLSEEQIKETVLNIIKFLDIEEVGIIDEIKNCGQTFDDVLRNIDNNAKEKKNIEIFVDADKSRYSLYPIIMKICSVMFDNFSNVSNINYNTSMLDIYDSATISSLAGIITQLEQKYNNIPSVKQNLEKIKSNFLDFSTIKIMFKLNKNDDYNDRFIELNFKKVPNTVTGEFNTGLNISRFFKIEDKNKLNMVTDSSVNAVSSSMNEIFQVIPYRNQFLDEIYTKIGNKYIDDYFEKDTKIKIFNIDGLKKDHIQKYNKLKNIYDKFREDYDDNKTLEENFDQYMTIFYKSYLLDSNNNIISSKEKVKTFFVNYNFVLNSYFKTIGDFAQMILVHQLQRINNVSNKDSIYLLISFDKISSYISSIFNSGTLKEEKDNPLLPLKFFKKNFNVPSSSSQDAPSPMLPSTSMDISPVDNTWSSYFYNLISNKKARTSFGKNNYKKIMEKYSRKNNNQKQKNSKEKSKEKNSKQKKSKEKQKKKNSKAKEVTLKQLQEIAKKYGLPLRKEYSKKDQLKRKLKHMFKLADKYKVKLNKNTYKNLYKLHISRLN